MSAMSELDLLRTEARAALNKWTAAQKLWERLETAGEAPAEEYAAGETMASTLRGFLQLTDQILGVPQPRTCKQCGVTGGTHKMDCTEGGDDSERAE